MRHRRGGQFHRVSSHLHRAADCGDSVRWAFWNTGCGSSLRLLSQTFAVDETSKQLTQGFDLNTFYWRIPASDAFISSFWQGYNARRLLDPDDGVVDNNQSVCVSNNRKEAPTGTDEKVFILKL